MNYFDITLIDARRRNSLEPQQNTLNKPRIKHDVFFLFFEWVNGEFQIKIVNDTMVYSYIMTDSAPDVYTLDSY